MLIPEQTEDDSADPVELAALVAEHIRVEGVSAKVSVASAVDD